MKKIFFTLLSTFALISNAQAVLPTDCDYILSGTTQYQQFQNLLNSYANDLNYDSKIKLCLDQNAQVVIPSDTSTSAQGFQVAINNIEIYAEPLSNAKIVSQRTGTSLWANTIFHVKNKSSGFKLSNVELALSSGGSYGNGVFVNDASAALLENVKFTVPGQYQHAIRVESITPESYTSSIKKINSNTFNLSNTSKAFSSVRASAVDAFTNNRVNYPAGAKSYAFSFNGAKIGLIQNLNQTNGYGITFSDANITELSNVTLTSVSLNTLYFSNSRVGLINKVFVVNPVSTTNSVMAISSRIGAIRNLSFTGTVVPPSNRVFYGSDFTGVLAENLKVNGACGVVSTFPANSFEEAVRCQ